MSTAIFAPGAGTFLEELGKNNNRDWFTAHRGDYDSLVRGPLERLLADAEARYGSGRVMRPNRDVRFSNDKSPYRTTASVWAGTVGGVYLQLDASGIETGGGLYEPSKDQLQRARQAIDEQPTAAGQLRDVVGQLEHAGFELAGPPLTTAPRGYARDHPEIDLLRLRHYAATRRLDITADTEEVWSAWRQVDALIAWADEHVGKALSWP